MKRLAIFASGVGTNFEAIVTACRRKEIDAEVVLMVCDRPAAKVIERAKLLNIPTFIFSPKSYASKADYEQEIVEQLDAAQVDLVCLAGYMRIISPVLLAAYRHRIVNIHPSLLPAFRGANAVEQAIEYGVKVFGVTIHWVDESLDGGKIIAQEAFAYEGNDPAEVHRIGQTIEHRLYPATIKKILNE